MDEIHRLIENRGYQSILSSSSVGKLKRSTDNLLAGKAWRFEIFPLVTHELKEKFELIKALIHGLMPSHYFSVNIIGRCRSGGGNQIV